MTIMSIMMIMYILTILQGKGSSMQNIYVHMKTTEGWGGDENLTTHANHRPRTKENNISFVYDNPRGSFMSTVMINERNKNYWCHKIFTNF